MNDAREPLGLDGTVTHLANSAQVLRDLAHAIAGGIALEPRFEAKGALADHLYDDLTGAAEADARLQALGYDSSRHTRPGAPLTDVLYALQACDLAFAYGRVKPAFATALEEFAARVDPLMDEATLALAVRLAHDQRRHADELPGTHEHPPVTLDLAQRRIPGGDRSAPAVLPAVACPARDLYVVEDSEADLTTLHALVHARLCAAEAAAREIHERPDVPAAELVALAEVAARAAGQARTLERVMSEETGVFWGAEGVRFDGEVSYRAPGGRVGEVLARLGLDTPAD